VEAKEGQPVLLLNFASDANKGVLQPAHTNVPARFSDSNIELKGRSVPPLRKILYWAPLNIYIHSLSLYVTGYKDDADDADADAETAVAAVVVDAGAGAGAVAVTVVSSAHASLGRPSATKLPVAVVTN